jgi:hypothetical protein
VTIPQWKLDRIRKLWGEEDITVQILVERLGLEETTIRKYAELVERERKGGARLTST